MPTTSPGWTVVEVERLEGFVGDRGGHSTRRVAAARTNSHREKGDDGEEGEMTGWGG